MKKVEVVAAIIKFNEEILCVQRPQSNLEYISNKFEFPGGKIENGETQIEALKRELKEELEIEPEINDLFLTVHHKYPDFELIMHSFLCKTDSKNLKLNEHVSLNWLTTVNLNSLDWAAADIPIVNKLMAND